MNTSKQVKSAWLKLLLRILIAAFALFGVAVLQHRLASFPLSVDVEKSAPPYTPAKAALIKEALVVDQLSQAAAGNAPTNSPPVLFSYDGNDLVTVEAFFDSAQLGNDIIELLRHDSQLKKMPPESRQKIFYTTADDEESQDVRVNPLGLGEPCRTSIQVSLAQGTKLPTNLHFYQVDYGSDKHLGFAMSAEGSDLIVELLTRNSVANGSGKIEGPGCSKSLTVGDWTYPAAFSSPVPLHFVVPAGTSVQVIFTALKNQTPWSRENGYEPFELEAVPLSAIGVRKVTPGLPLSVPLFSATAVESAHPLVLRHLRVKPNELQLDFSGRAMVQENGKYVATFDLWEAAKKYPLYAGLISALVGAFLEWLGRIVFRSGRTEQLSKKPKSSVEREPKERKRQHKDDPKTSRKDRSSKGGADPPDRSRAEE